MNPSSHDAGRVIAKALGTGPSRSTIAAQRDAVVDAMREASRVTGLPFLKVSLAAGLALAALAFLLRSSGERELSARFAGAPLGPSSQVLAQEKQAVEFSDGSRLSLEPRARIQLAELSTQRANVVLQDGRLSASIRKGTGRTWSVSAGPFDVRVVGTEFDVHWDPVQQAFGVSVREGKVLVFGKDLTPTGVALEAGARFERRFSPHSFDNPGREALGEAAAPSTPDPVILLPRNDAAAPTAEPDWAKLANEGQYKRALGAADRQGFERLTRELGENDLLLLANTARFAGDSPRARMALLKLRARFPRGSAAPVSALYLARIAEDNDRNPGEAANWLSAFLNESPRGGLAADARARLLSILLKQGNRARAREVAADYLKFHPDGPYASKARTIVESSK